MKEIRKTQPLRRIKDINAMKEVLPSIRDRIMFTLGINSALRISDIITLKCSDFKDGRVEIREKKTGKVKSFLLNPAIYTEIKDFIDAHPREWLFESKKGGHLERHQAWSVIKKASITLGLEHIGTHSMRKTFGYQAWKMGVATPLIQEALNHSNPRTTRIYLGINQDELDEGLYGQIAL